MSNTETQRLETDVVPRLFKGWKHLQGSLSVALPTSLKNANAKASAILRQK